MVEDQRSPGGWMVSRWAEMVDVDGLSDGSSGLSGDDEILAE